jgi:hypothetical protein
MMRGESNEVLRLKRVTNTLGGFCCLAALFAGFRGR